MTTKSGNSHADSSSGVSLLARLIRQLSSSIPLKEAFESFLPQALDSGNRIDSAAILLAESADGLTVSVLIGPQEALLRRMDTQALAKAHQNIGSAPIYLFPAHEAQTPGGSNRYDEVADKSVLAFPLQMGTRMIGFLVLACTDGCSELPLDEIELWEAVASLIALVASHASPEQNQNATHEQLRSEIIATLSHELRTPLSIIRGYTTALMLDEIEWRPEERLEFLHLMDAECSTMEMMIGDLMDSALIDAGQMSIEPEPMRLPLLVKEIVHEIQSHTDLHQFAVNFPAKFPILLADPHRITQVLRNILDNAVKYSPEGGLIVVRGEMRPPLAAVSIADPGIGISPEHLNSLFEKYFRVHSTAGLHVPGTGLGLPLARAIIEAHGGQIWAESKPGHGTTVGFTLPVYDPDLSLRGGM
jgi:K+-sensing histidine kinase KdpD